MCRRRQIIRDQIGVLGSTDKLVQGLGRMIECVAMPYLLKLSKCPDLVVNRGHYFGTDFLEPGEQRGVRQPGLSDADKRALIEFLKTF